MNKMIDDSLIGKIKKLFKSIWADEKGNVEVGKDLEVDGNAKVNGELLTDGAIYIPSINNPLHNNTLVITATRRDDYRAINASITLDGKAALIICSINKMNKLGKIETLYASLEPWFYSKAKYHHVITLTITNLSSDYKLFIDAYLSTNTPVDSPQDLVTYLGGGLYPVTGYFQLRAGANLIPLSLNTHAETYADYVFTFEGREDDNHAPQSMTLAELLSEIDALTITDDVSIPK